MRELPQWQLMISGSFNGHTVSSQAGSAAAAAGRQKLRKIMFSFWKEIKGDLFEG